MRRRWIQYALIVLITSWALALGATTLIKLDVESLTALSERVVVGTIASTEVKRADGRVFTYVTMRATDHWKGPESETLTFRTLGGELGGYQTIVPGASHFRAGEQVLVFLERPRPGAPLVVAGMSQGKFKVEIDPKTETPMAIPTLGSTPLLEREEAAADLMTPSRQGALLHASPSEAHLRPTPLEELERQVRAAQK